MAIIIVKNREKAQIGYKNYGLCLYVRRLSAIKNDTDVYQHERMFTIYY